ncbi:MAG: hypothetical protein HRU20_06020 [Pseudomonadales bacterium]|nr:hypothetical protein [Pseudomonadales bacterium]
MDIKIIPVLLTLLMSQMFSGCIEDSIDVATGAGSADFWVDVTEGGETEAHAVLINRGGVVDLADNEILSVHAFHHSYIFNNYLGIINLFSKVFFISDSTEAGMEYRFSWTRGGNGLDAENSTVLLPSAPALSIVGDNKITLGESIVIQWLVDPSADTMKLGTRISGCGIGFDVDGNIFYPELTEESIDPRSIRSNVPMLGVPDNGQITIASDPIIRAVVDIDDEAIYVKNILKVEFVEPSITHYCKVDADFKRGQAGTLDPNLHSGTITAYQTRTIEFYINVDALKLQ